MDVFLSSRLGRNFTRTRRFLSLPGSFTVQTPGSLVGLVCCLQGMSPLRPVRQMMSCREVVFNSLARGLSSARITPPLVVNLSCVYRLAAPQCCPVQAMKRCLLAHSWRRLGSKHHWGSSASLPHQVPNTLHGSPGLLWKEDCSLLKLRPHLLPPLKRCLFAHSWRHLGSKHHW